jgi:hypothetical protein
MVNVLRLRINVTRWIMCFTILRYAGTKTRSLRLHNNSYDSGKNACVVVLLVNCFQRHPPRTSSNDNNIYMFNRRSFHRTRQSQSSQLQPRRTQSMPYNSRKRKVTSPSRLLAVDRTSDAADTENGNNDDDDDDDDDDRIQQQLARLRTNYKVVESILQSRCRIPQAPQWSAAANTDTRRPQYASRLISIQTSGGYAEVPSIYATNRRGGSSVRCIVPVKSSSIRQQPCLLIPILNENDWWLLRQQQQTQPQQQAHTKAIRTMPLSSLELRRQNSILINHASNGLYDNLPYHWYNPNENTPERNDRTTATTPSLLGKRECYNVLLGKDWYLWKNSNTTTPDVVLDVHKSDVTDNTGMNMSLLQSRIQEIQLQEYQSQIAECDSNIAFFVAQQQQEQLEKNDNGMVDMADTLSLSTSSFIENENDDTVQYWQEQREILVQLLNNTTAQRVQSQTDEAQNERTSMPSNSKTDNSLWSTIQNLFNTRAFRPSTATTSSSVTTPMMEQTTTSVMKMSTKVTSRVPYRNTYDMIQKRICQDMLNADVVGVLLENMSLLNVESGVTLGGLILLQKKRPKTKQTLQLYGETVTISPSLSLMDDVYFVECHVDEAIGMSLACELPLWIERETWERGTVMCTRRQENTNSSDSNIEWFTNDPELSLLVEGQSWNASRTERVLPVRIPRITNLYDTMMMNSDQLQTTVTSSTKDLFPTDNIVQSIQQYDQMTIDDKARTFMAMSNTQQQPLPRRRTILDNPKLIDDLLLPYVDESVRYEYAQRNAKESGDTEKVQEMQQQQSMRSKAQMNLANAERRSNDSSDNTSNATREYWKKEVDLYTSLRADVTQDVGSYSQYLDRDEWYERDRQRMVQRMVQRQQQRQNNEDNNNG